MALLSPKQAADKLGVSTDTLRRWADNGKILCETTAGGHRRYRFPESSEQGDLLLLTLDEQGARPASPVRLERGEVESPSLGFPILRELEFPQAEAGEVEEPSWLFRLVIADSTAEERLRSTLGLAGTTASGYISSGALQFVDFECEAPTFGEAVGRMIDAVEGIAGHARVVSVERLGVLPQVSGHEHQQLDRS
jgi:excisionase family DNA binding protein